MTLLDSLSRTVPKHLATRKISLVSNFNNQSKAASSSSSNQLHHKQHSSNSYQLLSNSIQNNSKKFASSSLKTYFSKSSALIQTAADNDSNMNNNTSRFNHYSIGTVYEIADLPLSPITLKMIMSFGKTINQQTLVGASYWLKDELPKRLARQVKQLDTLPHGLNLMPSIRKVRELYLSSFNDVMMYNELLSKGRDEGLQFTRKLQDIYERHQSTIINVAKGVYELKTKMKESIFKNSPTFDFSEYSDLHASLDSFHINRIGMRTIIGQHLCLHEQAHQPRKGFIGLVQMETNPAHVAQQAIEHASDLCRMTYGTAPKVIIKGDTSIVFPYVPSYLYYILFELLKNSMRATVENHNHADLPPIVITISAANDVKLREHVCVKISDEGKGIPRRDLHKIWTHLYTTAANNVDMLNDDSYSELNGPFCGFGYGLPLSRLFAQYWGGDLQLMTMEGNGTDCYLYLHCLGETEEVIH
ncbi:hypothetical protein C9374_003552 [Naegleria lovaniensis]|uniref:Protein-serine/threonine kinase n=1 Tax=Naegleria lovaniensis TaxID=51637 RepID=A0AA88KQ15_NAELO|nr:uncharacterized protein C9374_003552 [Naegleria lovaniensis]KAG2393788.1 hypothetical protein C9374_003552 [Naegleria lovaniensis]